MTQPKIHLAKVSQKQVIEFVLLVVVFLIGLTWWNKTLDFVLPAIIVGVTGLLVPKILKPVAILWFTLANVLSIISTTIFLTVIYFLLVTPVGVIRRIMGLDNMNNKPNNQQSMLVDRVYNYSSKDFTKTF